jgi:hypothetical protein
MKLVNIAINFLKNNIIPSAPLVIVSQEGASNIIL